MSITYDLDCGDETITLELLDDGTLISYGFDIESEMIAKEMGFEPHPCFKAMDNALWKAVLKRNIEILEILLIAGANIHKWNDQALKWASENGHADVVKILLEYGADAHAWNDYALQVASEKGHADVVELLLEYGADVHANDDEAFRLAADNGHADVVEILLEHGADVHANVLRRARGKDHDAIVAIIKDWIKDHG